MTVSAWPTLSQKPALQRAVRETEAEHYLEAVTWYAEALKHGPDVPRIWYEMAICYITIGDAESAVAMLEETLRRDPDFEEARQALILARDFLPETTIEAAAVERETWWKYHGEPLWPPYYRRGRQQEADCKGRRFENARDPERPLRIGYLGGDFRMHSSAFIHSGIILHQDPGVQTFCYATQEDAPPLHVEREVGAGHRVIQADAGFNTIVTEEYRRASTFAYVGPLNDRELHGLIRADQIDILVDLAGHSAANRLRVFARRAAPIQITAWGYATGTGCRTMDYFFADPVTVPPHLRHHYCERIIDLPAIICLNPPYYMRRDPDDSMPGFEQDFPVIGDPPCLSGKPFTFGALTRGVKCSEETLGMWAEILRRAPGTRLVLKDASYDLADARARVFDFFEWLGYMADRVVILGSSPHPDHVRTYAEIDLCLDPYPHTGGVGSLEALWMGVPTLTRVCDLPASRNTASFYAALPQPSIASWKMFITGDRENYVENAVGFARPSFWPTLAQVRRELRGLFKASPLFAPNYAPVIYEAYREVWREWCRA